MILCVSGSVLWNIVNNPEATKESFLDYYKQTGKDPTYTGIVDGGHKVLPTPEYIDWIDAQYTNRGK